MDNQRLEDKEDLPVIELFRDQSRREMIAYALDELDTDTWVPAGDFVTNTDVGRESVRKKIGVLVAYGVLDVNDPDVNIPHYRLADTPVVEAIRQWSGYPLSELFAFRGRVKLVRFFLTQANPEESYSMNGIAKQTTLKNTTVSNHIDVLVDAGIAEAVEGTRSTEYTLDTNADLYVYLAELNELLYQTFQTRQ